MDVGPSVNDAIAARVGDRKGNSEIGHEWLAVVHNERHDVEQQAVGFARVEERQQVRVLQVRRHLDFRQEAFDAEDCAELRVEHFERNFTNVLSSCARWTVAMPPRPISCSTA